MVHKPTWVWLVHAGSDSSTGSISIAWKVPTEMSRGKKRPHRTNNARMFNTIISLRYVQVHHIHRFEMGFSIRQNIVENHRVLQRANKSHEALLLLTIRQQPLKPCSKYLMKYSTKARADCNREEIPSFDTAGFIRNKERSAIYYRYRNMCRLDTHWIPSKYRREKDHTETQIRSHRHQRHKPADATGKL